MQVQNYREKKFKYECLADLKIYARATHTDSEDGS